MKILIRNLHYAICITAVFRYSKFTSLLRNQCPWCSAPFSSHSPMFTGNNPSAIPYNWFNYKTTGDGCSPLRKSSEEYDPARNDRSCKGLLFSGGLWHLAKQQSNAFPPNLTSMLTLFQRSHQPSCKIGPHHSSLSPSLVKYPSLLTSPSSELIIQSLPLFYTRWRRKQPLPGLKACARSSSMSSTLLPDRIAASLSIKNLRPPPILPQLNQTTLWITA